jgi:hypothetical protein
MAEYGRERDNFAVVAGRDVIVVEVGDALKRVGSAFVGIIRWVLGRDRWESGRTVVENPGLNCGSRIDCGGNVNSGWG